MAKANDYDLDGWERAKKDAVDLSVSLQKLNAEREKYENIYFMDWKSSVPDPSIVETISPDGHNKVLGATRLMTSTSPKFSLLKQQNTAGVDRESDKLEKLANLMWTRSNKISGMKAERELAFTGFLFDEMHGQVISTRDLLDAANDGLKKAGDKDKRMWEGRVRAAEETNAFTPYLFEAINPKYGIGMRGRHGMQVYYKRMNRKALDVWNEWGDRAGSLRDKKQDVIYCEWWDEVNRYVWVEGEQAPILAKPHGLSFIPIECVTAEGTSMFESELRQREPLLYGVNKSGIWASQNVMLTAMMTNVNKLINAAFAFKQGSEGQTLDVIQNNIIGSVLNVPPGANIEPLMKQLLNPDAVKMLDMINQMFTESTLYDQALGQPISGVDNFSMVSLLAQAGRLPLIGVKEKMELMLSALMKKAFIWLKEDGQAYSTMTRQRESLEINPAQIPDHLEWEVSVEPDLPQDKMQMATLARAVTTGANPLASKRWARENILNVGQSDDMQKEIWEEQAADMRATMEAQEFMQALKAKMEQMNRPPKPMEGGDGTSLPMEGGQVTPPMEPMAPRTPMTGGGQSPQGGGG